MKLAIMQPYLFPYLGYFQLLTHVDRFVVYDDVQFMKGGWINRNSLLNQGKAQRFSLPLEGASPNRTIAEVQVSSGQLARWRKRFLKTLAQAYAKAPHRDAVIGIVDACLEDAAGRSVAATNTTCLLAVCEYLGLGTEVIESSAGYANDHLSGTDRVLDICAREQATTYVNAIGGVALYRPDIFTERGLELRFLRPAFPPYDQRQDTFVPGLSILDVLMWCSPGDARAQVHAGQMARWGDVAKGEVG